MLTIQKIVSEKSDDLLKMCVQELFEYHKTCVLKPDALTRMIEDEIFSIIGVGNETMSLRITETSIFEEAARRWACQWIRDKPIKKIKITPKVKQC